MSVCLFLTPLICVETSERVKPVYETEATLKARL